MPKQTPIDTIRNIRTAVPEATRRMNEAVSTVRQAFRPDRSQMMRLTPEQQVTVFLNTPMTQLDQMIQQRGPQEVERYVGEMMRLAQEQGRL